jgi:tetratricopeptide (TPR) repeat protein
MKIGFLYSTKRSEAEMKTCKLIFFVLVVSMIVPLNILAQNKEVPVTTSSREALRLFLDGRDKLDNIEFVAAASLFDKAIKQDPGFAMAYLYRAQSGGGYNAFRQNLDKAISLAGKASEGEKLEIQYFQAYAEGDGQKQKELLDKLLASFPSDKRIQAGAGEYFYSINDFSSALKYLLKAAELDKNFASAYNMIGYCQSALNNYTEAEKAFQTYIKLVPDRGNPYDSYAELLLKMGKYDESIAQYNKAVEKDPVNFAGSLNGIGNNYIFKSDYVSARKFYQDYYDKAPTPVAKLTALFWKAISYVHEGKIENAINAFDEYRLMAEKNNLVPNAITSYAYEGYVYTESGNPKEGMKLYDKAIDLLGKSKLPEADKENMITNSMMWHLYALVLNDELDKAVPELEKFKQKVESRKNPGEEMDLNSMYGLFEIKKGNYDKAIEYFSKANTENPWNWYYTAIAYNKKNDRQDALKLFEKITKLNVNSIELALVRKRAMEELKK